MIAMARSLLVVWLFVMSKMMTNAFKLMKPSNAASYARFMSMAANDPTKKELLEAVSANVPKGSTVVIKYGGHAMENFELATFFCEDIADLCRIGILPIVVHGGGPQIKKTLETMGIESRFVNGLRVTDEKVMETAQMVLCGQINKNIVGMISNNKDIKGALGLCGLDSNLIQAKIKDPDLGLVGDPTGVNSELLKGLTDMGLVPVIAPVGCNQDDGGSLNINADTAAGAVAEGVKAERLLLLTDITGVLDKNKVLMETIKSTELPKFIADGTISGGMIPKLETASQAVEAGVKVVGIMDGRVKHCVLRALSGEVFGTKIVKA